MKTIILCQRKQSKLLVSLFFCAIKSNKKPIDKHNKILPLNIPESRSIHLQYLGNTDLLQLPKTAFLCSRHISASAVLKCYDWATEQRRQGVCVIGGFHSPLEKDVFQILIKGSQPLVMVLGRAMYKNLPEIYQTALLQNRLLIVSVAPSTPPTLNAICAQTQQIHYRKCSKSSFWLARSTRRAHQTIWKL